jgi:hypothetical protein
MAKCVIGFFDTLTEAQAVVQDLMNNGFPREHISLVMNEAGGESALAHATATDAKRTGGALAGAGTGAVLGGVAGLLVGLGTLAIPGIGPVVAAGPLAAALGGAGMGTAAGGLIGALTALGVPEEEVQDYAEGLRRGHVLVTVQVADQLADRAAEIMRRHGTIPTSQPVSPGRTQKDAQR